MYVKNKIRIEQYKIHTNKETNYKWTFKKDKLLVGTLKILLKL